MAESFATANRRYERNMKKYGRASAPASSTERRRREARYKARESGRPDRSRASPLSRSFVRSQSGLVSEINRMARGGSMVRGTSTYSRASQFRIAEAAARNRGNRPINLSYNKRSGLYEASSEARRSLR